MPFQTSYAPAPAAGKPVSQQAVSRHMSQVYLWMSIGLMLTACVGYYLYNHISIAADIVKNPLLFYGIMIAQFAAVISFTRIRRTCTASTAKLLYVGYSLLSGLTFGVILLMYTQQDIAYAFSITAGSFFALSLFGYATKKDLGPIGTFCTMGLFGLLIGMVLAMFMPSLRTSAMQLSFSTIGLIVFAGLTAYDTQRIKNEFIASQGTEGQVSVISGALMLYLDFINMFLFILRFFRN